MTQFEYQNAGNDEASQKKTLSYLLTQVSAGKASTGVLSGLLASQTATASTGVLIDAGAAVVQAATLDGASVLVNDTQITLDVLTANPVGGLPRNDIIVFDLATLTSIGSGGSGGLRAIIGTPNASPTDPTVPTSAVPLARLRHAASATTIPAAKIDDLRQPTAAFGQRVVVANTTQRDALVKYDGLAVWRTDVHRREEWDGTGWLTEVYGMDLSVSTNGNGEFSFSTGLASILYANLYNGNGGIVRAGNKQNITIARNSTGASYSGGTVTGIAFAADTHTGVASTTIRLDWIAKGYAS